MITEKINEKWEWKTLALVAGCYGAWLGLTASYTQIEANFGVAWAVFMLFFTAAVVAAFHTSLQHEVVHGHPTPYPLLNEALVFPSLILVYPFRRYKELHLIHHVDENLTDPYDDPESYYWAQCRQQHIGRVMQMLLAFNNTFVGRMLLGAPLGLVGFYRTETHRLVANEPGVRKAWALHLVGCLPVYFWVVQICGIPFWIYLVFVVYPGVSWILIRSFAEHQAVESIGGRSAIVEAHPFFAMLYLNNNLHIVHHAHPNVAWYDLPALYRERREIYLAANGGYLFRGYGEVIRKFGFRRKQPVFHPWLRREIIVDETPKVPKTIGDQS